MRLIIPKLLRIPAPFLSSLAASPRSRRIRTGAMIVAETAAIGEIETVAVIAETAVEVKDVLLNPS